VQPFTLKHLQPHTHVHQDILLHETVCVADSGGLACAPEFEAS